MNFDQEIKTFNEYLQGTQAVQILLPETIDRDGVAAALSLYLSLQQKGKSVSIAYPKAVTVAWSSLVGVNKISQYFSTKNFIISLDYIEGTIEKVSYNIEGNKFNLVIEPRPDAPPFNEKSVQYHYGGATAGLFITIDSPQLTNLGKFYEENKTVFEEKKFISFSGKSNDKSEYAKLSLHKAASSTSEVVTQFIKQGNFGINSDISSNLYDGLLSGSRNFTHTEVGVSTFESAAWLLRNGARKPQGRTQQEDRPKLEQSSNNLPESITPPDWFKPKIFKSGSGGLV